MTNRQLRRRIRARLYGERGFTIIETMIAVTVVFGSLTALAFTATVGFKYIGFSRQRVQATGIANEVMEKVRALPYASLTSGMSTNDPTFSTDTTYIKSCSGVYRFQSCTLGSDGAGEKIVYGTGAAGSVSYLINHQGTVTTAGTTYSWSTYVTNENAASNPYRVTAIVSWSGSQIASASSNSVKIQSLFWSPSGCVSSATHPFAAPCQAFFYGKAEVPSSVVSLTGSLHNSGVDFTSGEVALPEATVTAQQEQVTNLSGTVASSGLSIDDSAGTATSGGTITSYQADNDVTSTTSSVNGGSPTGGAAALSRVQPDAGGTIGLQLAVPAGDTSGVGLSTTASSSDANACPPSGTRENDALPCAGAQVKQSGTITATVPVDHAISGVGSMTAVRIQAPSTASTALANRTAVSGYDGLMTTSATRYLGTIQIGGFPISGMTAPTGMTATNTADTNYCVRLVGYQDSVSGSAGPRTATGPTSTINAGTFYYLSGGAYLSKSVTDSTLTSLPTITCSKSQTISGKTVTWSVTITSGQITPASAPAPTSATTADAQTRTEITALTTPFDLTCQYKLVVGSTTEVDLTIGLDLGQLSANAVYGPPPTAG